jgi:hypothetical protein
MNSGQRLHSQSHPVYLLNVSTWSPTAKQTESTNRNIVFFRQNSWMLQAYVHNTTCTCLSIWSFNYL